MRQLVALAESEAQFCPVFGAHVVQAGIDAPRVLQELRVLEQHHKMLSPTGFFVREAMRRRRVCVTTSAQPGIHRPAGGIVSFWPKRLRQITSILYVSQLVKRFIIHLACQDRVKVDHFN
jgi:hypothetical protein